MNNIICQLIWGIILRSIIHYLKKKDSSILNIDVMNSSKVKNGEFVVTFQTRFKSHWSCLMGIRELSVLFFSVNPKLSRPTKKKKSLKKTKPLENLEGWVSVMPWRNTHSLYSWRRWVPAGRRVRKRNYSMLPSDNTVACWVKTKRRTRVLS